MILSEGPKIYPNINKVIKSNLKNIINTLIELNIYCPTNYDLVCLNKPNKIYMNLLYFKINDI